MRARGYKVIITEIIKPSNVIVSDQNFIYSRSHNRISRAIIRQAC